MNYRTVAGISLLLWGLLAASAIKAQSVVPPPSISFLLSPPETNPSGSLTVIPPCRPETISLQSALKPSLQFSKTNFLLLSAGVYAAGFADMHATLANRHYSWWYETDPLARPLVHLPSPAYYSTGLALATGVNWISWKMAHSRRWHKLAPIPQLLAISGNLAGFRSNLD